LLLYYFGERERETCSTNPERFGRCRHTSAAADNSNPVTGRRIKKRSGVVAERAGHSQCMKSGRSARICFFVRLFLFLYLFFPPAVMRFTACALRFFFFFEKHDPTESTFYPSRPRDTFLHFPPRGEVTRSSRYSHRRVSRTCKSRYLYRDRGPVAIGRRGGGGRTREMIKCIYTRAHGRRKAKRRNRVFFPHCRAYVSI
jgi:hypothetical protein